MTKKNRQKKMMMREDGFTLIEIIAVLIILGILAAVAVPKYFDVSDEAKRKAFKGALAEGLSLCSLAYSKAVLDLEGQPKDAKQVLEALKGDPVTVIGGTVSSHTIDAGSGSGSGAAIDGDFTLSLTVQGSANDEILIEAIAKGDLAGWNSEVVAADRQKIWKLP